MPAALPNRNNKTNLSVAQSADANSAIKNFLKSINFPPTTAEDSAKMRAAIVAFKEQVKKTKVASAKQLKGSAASSPPAQLAAQTLPVGNLVADLAKYLPSRTNLANISFSESITSMENTISQMEKLIQNPAAAGIGGGVKGSDAVNVRDK